MMPRGRDGAEGIVGGTRHHPVHGVDGGAGGAKGCVEALGAHRSIRIEPDETLLGACGADCLHIALRWTRSMTARSGKRRLLALKRVEGGRGKRVGDGAQAIGALRMALAHIVKQAVWMGEEERWH